MATPEESENKLQAFFKDIRGTIGDNWVDILLENARRVSVPLAAQMLDQLGLDANTNTPFKLLDNGCGIGVVASELQSRIKPDVLRQSSIVCGDFSQPVVEAVQKRIKEEGWVNTVANTIDAQKTGIEDGSFTHITMNIGFHVVPDSEAALDETIRMLKPGGTIGFTTWHRAIGWGPDLEDAFAALPFPAPFKIFAQTTSWGDWADLNWIRRALLAKGLKDVKVEPCVLTQHADSADYFVRNFAMIINWLMSVCWSEELRKEHPAEEVHKLVKEFLEKKHEGKGWELVWVGLVATARVG